MAMSLRWLLLLTFISALWLYAFLFPYSAFIHWVYTAVLLALAAGLILSIVSPRRLFWIAFTTVAASYCLLTLPPISFDTVRPWLITDWPLHAYGQHCEKVVNEDMRNYSERLAAANAKGQPPPSLELVQYTHESRIDPYAEDFVPRSASEPYDVINWNLSNIFFIGHAYFALVAGLIAGFFATWMQRRKQRSSTPPAQRAE